MTFDKIKEIIKEELSVNEDKITLDASFKEDLGADSLDAVELIMRIEDEFDISISEEAVQNLKTVNDIVEYVDACKK